MIYGDILKKYCSKEFGFDKNWTFKSNIIAVETFGDHCSKCFSIPEAAMNNGLQEFENLMKMVGYYTIFGYEEEVEFI